jgi:hypothetical protein
MSQPCCNAPSLEFKPDFAEARRRWEAYWAGEIIDRPCIAITCAKEGRQAPPGPPYMAGAEGNFGPVVDQAVACAEAIFWGGEAIPNYVPSFGPDQFGAFLGGDLKWSDTDHSTNWVVPFVESWEDALPLQIKPDDPWWVRLQAFMRALGEAAAGKMVISHIDLHSNMDALSAIRLPARLCVDFYDCPELIDRAMQQVRALYAYVYDTLWEAAGMNRAGTVGWVPAYHWHKTNTIQCDFAALCGPEHFRRWILPALEEEAAFLDACMYHFDGPECLVHLDDICAIPKLGAIQWTPGARNKAMMDWLDLLKEIQSKGQGLYIGCSVEELRIYHRELRPEKVFYQCGVGSEQQVEETLKWLVDNT